MRRNSVLHPVAVALGLAVLLAPGPCARAAEAASTCPRSLSAWVIAGGFGDGEEWSARLLNIQGERGRLEELRIRSETPRMAEEEARWFMPERRPGPEPVDVVVGAKVFLGESLQALCKELSEAGLATMQSKAKINERKKSTGEIEEQRVEMTVTDERGGVRSGVHVIPVPAADAAPAQAAPGAPAQAARRRTTVVLQQEDLADDAEEEDDEDGAPKAPPTPDAAKAKEMSRLVLGAIRAVVDRNARTLVSAPNDFAGIPAARRILGTLDEMDEDGLPEGLPSDFLLEATTAPREYAVALCVEAIARDEEEDRVPALRRLGDQPSPVAVDELVVVLQEPAKSKTRQDMAILALRALLKADPDQARLQAVRFLSGARPVVRAALGVFEATEPPLAQEIRSLDLTDGRKVLEVTNRLKKHLAETAADPALRKAAAAV